MVNIFLNLSGHTCHRGNQVKRTCIRRRLQWPVGKIDLHNHGQSLIQVEQQNEPFARQTHGRHLVKRQPQRQHDRHPRRRLEQFEQQRLLVAYQIEFVDEQNKC